MKRLLVILFILFSIVYTCFSQNKLHIIDKDYQVKSRNTYYKEHKFYYFDFLYKRKDKYLKLFVNGEILNNEFDSKNVKIVLSDSLGNQLNIKSLYRGQRYLDGMKIKEKKKYEKKYIPFSYKFRNKHTVIKFYLRMSFIDAFSSWGIGFRLHKGIYNIYLEYKTDNNIIKSNTVNLIVK